MCIRDRFISAPFLAILAYYLIEPSNTTNAVALAFTAGFASETILLMVRSIANKISPNSRSGPQYGAIAGVVTLSNKDESFEKPAQKAEVLISESPQIHSITDEKGFYILGNVPVGEHCISIKYTTQVNNKLEERTKKDTVKIERAQAIVKKMLSSLQKIRHNNNTCLLYTSILMVKQSLAKSAEACWFPFILLFLH